MKQVKKIGQELGGGLTAANRVVIAAEIRNQEIRNQETIKQETIKQETIKNQINANHAAAAVKNNICIVKNILYL